MDTWERDYREPKLKMWPFVLLLLLGVAYIVWLDFGCEISGFMTLEGKICIESL